VHRSVGSTDLDAQAQTVGAASAGGEHWRRKEHRRRPIRVRRQTVSGKRSGHVALEAPPIQAVLRDQYEAKSVPFRT
jgi:hypothetical protein